MQIFFGGLRLQGGKMESEEFGYQEHGAFYSSLHWGKWLHIFDFALGFFPYVQVYV